MEAVRGRGRPRDPETGERILRSALDQLAEEGYAGMSIDAVARAAGVSKATIYRRYPDKEDLVTAAIAAYSIQDVENLTGSTREKITAVLQAARERMIDRGSIVIMHQILVESERNPKLVELHRERTIRPKVKAIIGLLEEGVAAGEVRPDVDLGLVTELLTGAWMARWNHGEPFPEDWSQRIIDTIWPAISA